MQFIECIAMLDSLIWSSYHECYFYSWFNWISRLCIKVFMSIKFLCWIITHLTWIARKLLFAYVKHDISKCCKTLRVMQMSNALTDKKFT